MEEGMQPPADNAQAETQAPAQGPCGLEALELVARLLDRAYCGKSVDTLCEQAANEIVRLHKIIDDYAAICRHSSNEINALRAAKERIVVVP